MTPVLPLPHHATVAVVFVGSLALIGVITLNHMPAADAPQIARIDLPRGLCTRPTDGNVLHITVAQHQGEAGQYVVDCKTYGPRGRAGSSATRSSAGTR